MTELGEPKLNVAGAAIAAKADTAAGVTKIDGGVVADDPLGPGFTVATDERKNALKARVFKSGFAQRIYHSLLGRRG